jgi:hypothetical protein
MRFRACQRRWRRDIRPRDEDESSLNRGNGQDAEKDDIEDGHSEQDELRAPQEAHAIDSMRFRLSGSSGGASLRATFQAV